MGNQRMPAKLSALAQKGGWLAALLAAGFIGGVTSGHISALSAPAKPRPLPPCKPAALSHHLANTTAERELSDIIDMLGTIELELCTIVNGQTVMIEVMSDRR
jgi:hypothetical protein